MIKTYRLEELDCAHCAAKIEEAVARLEGVTKSTVTFLTQKLTVEVEEARAGEITGEIKRTVKKFEPDVEVLEK